MKFAYIPKADYKVGQVIEVHGKPMQVVSTTYSGRNLTVHSLDGVAWFERIVCICTDAEPIIEVAA